MLANKFRELREAWFEACLYRHVPERDEETELVQVTRESNNIFARREFDKQTELIINGQYALAVPRSISELCLKAKEK